MKHKWIELAKAKLTKLLKNSYVKTILLGVILLGAVFAFWFGLRIGLRTDHPLLAVASGSMVPTLNVGDLIIVQGISNYSEVVAAQKPIGDIIVFTRPVPPEDLIVHRAVAKSFKDGLWYFTTQGDHNGTPDPWGPVPETLVVGKVVGVVPWIGNLPLFIRTPSGLLLIILLFLVIVFIEYVPVLSKKAKTEAKEETRAEPEAENKPES